MFLLLHAQPWSVGWALGISKLYTSQDNNDNDPFIAGSLGVHVGYHIRLGEKFFIRPMLLAELSFPRHVKDDDLTNDNKGKFAVVDRSTKLNGITISSSRSLEAINEVGFKLMTSHINLLTRIGMRVSKIVAVYSIIGGGLTTYTRGVYMNNNISVEGSNQTSFLFNGMFGVGASVDITPKMQIFAELRSAHGFGSNKTVLHAPRLAIGLSGANN